MTNQELLDELKLKYPAVYTMLVLQEQMLKLVEYGEIHLTEFVVNGKVIRIEASPKISKKLDNI